LGRKKEYVTIPYDENPVNTSKNLQEKEKLEIIERADEVARTKYQNQKHAKKYSNETKNLAVALYDSGNWTFDKIADMLSVHSHSTLQRWIHGKDKSMTPVDQMTEFEFQEAVSKAKEKLSGKNYLISDALLDQINDEKISKASLLQIITASAITGEKARLHSNQSTENIALNYQRQAQYDRQKKKADDEIHTLQLEIEEIQEKLK
jgi:transposase-like protein